MLITLQNLLDLAAEKDAFPELADIPLDCGQDGGLYHLPYAQACTSRYSRNRVKVTLGAAKDKICPICAAERNSLESVCGYGDIVVTWVSARRWLSKPTRANGRTQVKRTHEVEQALRSASFRSSQGPWVAVLTEDLQRMLPTLSGRIGSRDDALAKARAVVAKSVGGDASLLDETPMLLTLRSGYRDVSDPTTEALRRQCALRSETTFRVLEVPAWTATYLLRRGVTVTDFAPAGEDADIIQTAVALYDPTAEGPLGLLCSALATARNALTV